MTWKIECEPDGKNDGVNECGMVVYLTQGPTSTRKEVGAAGFLRENALNPEKTLDEAFTDLVRKAKRALKLQLELEEATADVERVMA